MKLTCFLTLIILASPAFVSSIPIAEDQPKLSANKQACLDEINNERSLVNVPALQWSSVLEANAQAYVDSITKDGTCTFKRSNKTSRIDQSERLAKFDTADATTNFLLDTVKAFNSQKSCYVPGLGKSGYMNEDCHNGTSYSGKYVNSYTQNVWKGTRFVGCAQASTGSCSQVVCRYFPPGNYKEEDPFGSETAGSVPTTKTDTPQPDSDSTEVGGNTDGGNTDSGNTDSGNTDGGNTDGGNTDGGSTDGGNTDSGNTTSGGQTSHQPTSVQGTKKKGSKAGSKKGTKKGGKKGSTSGTTGPVDLTSGGNDPGNGKVDTQNPISYHGGGVLTGEIKVYYIYYGTFTQAEKDVLENFMSGISSTPYWNITRKFYSQKGASKTYAADQVTLAGTYEADTSLFGTSISGSDIPKVIKQAISEQKVSADPNTMYGFLVGSGVDFSGYCQNVCGYHTGARFSGNLNAYFFAGKADHCPGCGLRKPSPNGLPGTDAMITTIAHELVESVSDPWGDGWKAADGEAMDKCNFRFGDTQTDADGAKYNLQVNNKNYLVQQIFDPDNQRCQISA